MAKKKADAAPSKKAASKTNGTSHQPRLKLRYKDDIVPKLQKEFGIENVKFCTCNRSFVNVQLYEVDFSTFKRYFAKPMGIIWVGCYSAFRIITAGFTMSLLFEYSVQASFIMLFSGLCLRNNPVCSN